MRRASLAVAILMVVTLAACSSGGSRATTAPPTAGEQQPEVVTPEPMEEEVVGGPGTGTMVSEEVTEELPEDLAMLNARGYLQDVFFDTDSYELKPEAKQSLVANAEWLKEYPSVKVLVEGHCDERNTREYNLALGERRASAVEEYLVLLGVSPDRVRTISYGEERPFAVGHDESAWQLNRRAHFVITAR
jgi:peptidoglycan-associated lipoprotein